MMAYDDIRQEWLETGINVCLVLQEMATSQGRKGIGAQFTTTPSCYTFVQG